MLCCVLPVVGYAVPFVCVELCVGLHIACSVFACVLLPVACVVLHVACVVCMLHA